MERSMARFAFAAVSFGYLCAFTLPFLEQHHLRSAIVEWSWLGATFVWMTTSLAAIALATIALARKAKAARFLAIVALVFAVPGVFAGALLFLLVVREMARL